MNENYDGGIVATKRSETTSILMNQKQDTSQEGATTPTRTKKLLPCKKQVTTLNPTYIIDLPIVTCPLQRLLLSAWTSLHTP
jgi:hypothetical protein